MEAGNLFCETESCGKPAEFFGMRKTAKYRCCGEHAKEMLNKGLQVFDIASYYFITTLKDAAKLEERKILAAKGRGNLIALEEACESELKEALQTIEDMQKKALRAVEDRFEEMKVVVIGTCQEVKKQFESLRFNLTDYLTVKENQLNPTALLACVDMIVTPTLLRFGVADLSDHISAELSVSWSVAAANVDLALKCCNADRKKEVVKYALAEVAEYSKKGIQGALQHANSLIGEEENKYEQEKEEVVTGLLKFEKMRIEENLKWLQRSWNLAQRYPFPGSLAARVGQRFAGLLFHQHIQVSIAEEILAKCYNIEQVQSPLSEQSMSLCVDMCELYYASEQLDKLENLGRWTLQAFAPAGYRGEYYWVVIFYLMFSAVTRKKYRS